MPYHRSKIVSPSRCMSHHPGYSLTHQHVLPVSHRVVSHIRMCFLCYTGSFSHQHVLPMSHIGSYLTSTCASCVTQGRSHINMYVLPMSHRAGITTSCIIQGLSYVT
jgi:hypothetical protein